MISLWVAVILSMMAVGLGHRLSMALRLSGYQKDKLKSLYQAKSGLTLAISGLESDDPSYDALTDSWAQEDEEGFIKVVDEERKININTASKELLTALLEEYSFSDIEARVNNILIWRGDIPDEAKIYEGLGYSSKGAVFTNCQELLLVKDFQLQDYQLLKDTITVYPGDKVNINTAAEDVLTILANSVAQGAEQQNAVASVVTGIINIRNDPNRGPFKDIAAAQIDAAPGSADESLFNNLKPKLTVASSYFTVESTGNAGKIKTRIEAVYNRAEKKTTYWHER